MEQIKRRNGKLILGEGEVTGHVHSIANPSAKMYQAEAGLLQLELPTQSTIRHEIGDKPAEHRDIQLPSGEPVVSQKRQYTRDGDTNVVD